MVNQKTLMPIIALLFLTLNLFGQDFVNPKKILPQLQNKFKNQSVDNIEHIVRRMGNKKISLEAYVSLEADWLQLKSILKHINEYPKWVLPRINERSPGDKFFIQFASITPAQNLIDTLDVEVFLSLPALKIPIRRLFHFELLPQSDDNTLTMRMTALASTDSAVKDLSGYAHFFKNPKNPSQIWVYLDVYVILTHWLVYESLPERLLAREVGDRLRIIIENYQNYENTKGVKIP